MEEIDEGASVASRKLQRLSKLFVQLCHLLRDQFRVSKDRHEVGVAVPARDDVEMYVLVDARPGYTTNVRADVEPIGIGDFLENDHHSLQERHQLKRFFIRKIGDIIRVAIGDDHQVSAVVGKEIHDHVTELAATDDQVFVVFIVPEGFAEDAFAFIVV